MGGLPRLKKQRRVISTDALDGACFALARERPALSARRTLTIVQCCVIVAACGLIGWPAAAAPSLTLGVAVWTAFVFFALLIALRLTAAAASLTPRPHSGRRWAAELPVYTLLCPLFREAEVAADLIAAIERIDYPRNRLDVKIILEEDDVETIAVVDALRLGPHFQIIVAPRAEPQTKPKALNYALAYAHGEFVAVYDAEDIPHPGQLKAALDAFAEGGPDLAVVQAPLRIHNSGARWIAAQFAAEYAVQFSAILPFLARLGLPLPLGGTSNHFRKSALDEAGGWDPFNVTEDADLGYRLARFGLKANVIAPATYEEAPISLRAWKNQRTRWIKGHMQTWLVLMRNPVAAAREMGAWSFLSMQLVLLGGIVAAFAHGPIAALIVADIAFGWRLCGEIGWALALSGYATAFYCVATAAAVARDWRVAAAALTMPLYWPLATWAACAALVQLATHPHHWDKTEHGLSKRPT